MQVFFARFTKERSIWNHFTVLYEVKLQYRVDKALKRITADTYSCTSQCPRAKLKVLMGFPGHPDELGSQIHKPPPMPCWSSEKMIAENPFFIHSVLFYENVENVLRLCILRFATIMLLQVLGITIKRIMTMVNGWAIHHQSPLNLERLTKV